MPIIEPWNSCPADVDNYQAWIPERPPLQGDITSIPPNRIYEIAQGQRDAAISLLTDHEVIELSAVQAAAITDGAAKIQEDDIRPFLIRNVVPSFISSLNAGPVQLDRIGSGLRIRAGLFGCGGFTKNPLVVMLPVAPDRVDIQVSAIW